MKTLLILILSAGIASATEIAVDLGVPPGTITGQTLPSSFSEFNGVFLNGQTLSLDFTFTGEEFVRILPITASDFEVSLAFHTSGDSLLGFLDGTAYLTDIDGNPIPGGEIGRASSDNGDLYIGLFPHLSTDHTRPFDFYGVHFDITLPDKPRYSITGADLELFDSTVFEVGPSVADSGSTAILFALGVAAVAIFGARRWGPPQSV